MNGRKQLHIYFCCSCGGFRTAILGNLLRSAVQSALTWYTSRRMRAAIPRNNVAFTSRDTTRLAITILDNCVAEPCRSRYKTALVSHWILPCKSNRSPTEAANRCYQHTSYDRCEQRMGTFQNTYAPCPSTMTSVSPTTTPFYVPFDGSIDLWVSIGATTSHYGSSSQEQSLASVVLV